MESLEIAMPGMPKAYGSVPCLGECGASIALTRKQFERCAFYTCPNCHPLPDRPQLPRFTRTGGFRALDERIRDTFAEGS